MQDFLDVFKQRRSIRKFQSRPVPLETIRDVLNVAGYAPSAHNAQPWRFIVLTEASIKRMFAEAMAEAWNRDLERDGVETKKRIELTKASIERISNIPLLILSCLTLQDMMHFPDEERDKNEHDLAVQSLSAAIQNILLYIHAEGLGACWLCSPLFCKKAVKKALELPNEIEPQALIGIGYPAEKPSTPRRKSLKAIASLNKWGNPI